MTQALNLANFANFLNSSGQVSNAGLQSPAVPSGSLMLFQQTSAPTGWTKQTTHNDKALRVVSGTASSGGSSAFTTVFTNQTPIINTSGLSAGATTLSLSQIPSHDHSVSTRSFVDELPFAYIANYDYSNQPVGSSGFSNHAVYPNGGGGSHSHSISGSATSSAITLNVQYVDLIIASKD